MVNSGADWNQDRDVMMKSDIVRVKADVAFTVWQEEAGKEKRLRCRGESDAQGVTGELRHQPIL
jgi:hypothetical protein